MRNAFDAAYIAQGNAYEAAREEDELIEKLRADNTSLYERVIELEEEVIRLKAKLYDFILGGATT